MPLSAIRERAEGFLRDSNSYRTSVSDHHNSVRGFKYDTGTTPRMDDALRERVEALERAVTDGEHDLSGFADDAAAVDRLDTLEADVEDLADRIEELEAATQALRGYVGNIRSVNTEVEQRADAALAKAEELERRLPETTATADTNGHGSSTASDTPDRGDSATGPDDRGGGDDPAGSGETAVDEWEWVTDDDTGGTGGAHADARTESDTGGTAGMDVGGASASDSGRAATTSRRAGGGGPAHGKRERTPPHNERAGAATDPPSGNDTGPPRHGDSAGHRRSETTPAGGERTGRPHRETDGRRCASCGQPHPSDGASATRDTPGREPPGAPTVAEIAESDPAGIGSGDDAPGDDGDVLPDGAEDPLIGAGDDDRSGTLQRIRDLL